MLSLDGMCLLRIETVLHPLLRRSSEYSQPTTHHPEHTDICLQYTLGKYMHMYKYVHIHTNTYNVHMGTYRHTYTLHMGAYTCTHTIAIESHWILLKMCRNSNVIVMGMIAHWCGHVGRATLVIVITKW